MIGNDVAVEPIHRIKRKHGPFGYLLLDDSWYENELKPCVWRGGTISHFSSVPLVSRPGGFILCESCRYFEVATINTWSIGDRRCEIQCTMRSASWCPAKISLDPRFLHTYLKFLILEVVEITYGKRSNASMYSIKQYLNHCYQRTLSFNFAFLTFSMTCVKLNGTVTNYLTFPMV